MKRFRELIIEVRNRYLVDDFFKDFENSCRTQPAKRKHYRSYDDALMLLGDESWNTLKDDLSTKDPIVSSYEVRPGILATPRYTAEDQVCELWIQKQNADHPVSFLCKNSSMAGRPGVRWGT
jgi:hypothetical protein